ncbi:MAG TPA: hypothetical protein VMV77_14095 [Bacteroidales bacterium]|nr:hypothetical protein [Bacteroidales bacterium]
MFTDFTRYISFLKGVTKHALLFLAGCFLLGSALGQSSNLFDSDEVMELTLRGDLKAVFKDRGDDPQYHPATLHYQADQNAIKIPIEIKTRGHFRKMAINCSYSPILLNFAKSSTPKSSVFKDQDKVKLVTPCRSDQYVIHEYLVYKLYNLITPKSFKARLVKVIYQDTVKNKSSDPYYGILLEEEAQMAMRNLSRSLEKIGLRPEKTQKGDFLKMAVFEYMIGNTDWSVQFQQNIKLITVDSTSLPTTIPYDFDHAGIVRAPYAKPAEELQMSSTLQRRYRGYCIPEMNQFTEVFETFNQLKDDFYALYEGNPLLTSSYQNQTLKFLDQFYETINDPNKALKEFSYPCDRSGTGNIVIQGLKKIE